MSAPNHNAFSASAFNKQDSKLNPKQIMTHQLNRSHRRNGRLFGSGSLMSLVVLLMFSFTNLHAASPRVVITPSAGYTIAWDGNNGGFSSPDVGAGPSNNMALASNGTVAFSSSDLGPELAISFHVASNLNDGL
jgi:hypothetical protein